MDQLPPDDPEFTVATTGKTVDEVSAEIARGIMDSMTITDDLVDHHFTRAVALQAGWTAVQFQEKIYPQMPIKLVQALLDGKAAIDGHDFIFKQH